jgi:hypothetical protein
VVRPFPSSSTPLQIIVLWSGERVQVKVCWPAEPLNVACRVSRVRRSAADVSLSIG